MIKTLVIHLGDTKTGSTAIQSVLRSGEYKTPNGQTVCYPGEGLNHNRLPKGFSKKGNAEQLSKHFQGIAKELKASNADYGVISAELFQGVEPSDLHKVLWAEMPEFTDRLRLLSYVRPHAERLVSTFSEQAKFGNVTGDVRDHFKAMRRSKKLFYTPRFLAWRKTFGDQFSLRFFHRDHLQNGDAVDDFFFWMFEETGTDVYGTPLANASLSAAQVALLLRFFGLMPRKTLGFGSRNFPPSVARALVAQFRSTGLGADMGRIEMSEDLAETLKLRLKKDAWALDAEFFESTPMTDALESIPEKLIGTNDGFDATAFFSEETLKAFDAMARMSILLMGDDPKDIRARANEVRQVTKLVR